MIRKAFANTALVTSQSLKVYESCIPSKKQEQLNCKEVYSIIQMRTFYAEKWDHAVQYQFSGLTE